MAAFADDSAICDLGPGRRRVLVPAPVFQPGPLLGGQSGSNVRQQSAAVPFALIVI